MVGILRAKRLEYGLRAMTLLGEVEAAEALGGAEERLAREGAAAEVS